MAINCRDARNPHGLGYAVDQRVEAMQPQRMFAYVIFIGLLAILLNAALMWLSRRHVARSCRGKPCLQAATDLGHLLAALPPLRGLLPLVPGPGPVASASSATIAIFSAAKRVVGQRRGHDPERQACASARIDPGDLHARDRDRLHHGRVLGSSSGAPAKPDERSDRCSNLPRLAAARDRARGSAAARLCREPQAVGRGLGRDVADHAQHGFGRKPARRIVDGRVAHLPPQRCIDCSKIILPAVVPDFLLGLRIAIPLGIIITLLVEMLTSLPGVGSLIVIASGNFVPQKSMACWSWWV